MSTIDLRNLITGVFLTSESIIHDKSRIAMALKIPKDLEKELSIDFRVGKISAEEYFFQVLSNWIERESTLVAKDQVPMHKKLKNILVELQLQDAAELLDALVSRKQTPVTILVSKTEPFRPYALKSVVNFVGRATELKEMQDIFESGLSYGIILSGPNGIGKTSLALKFTDTILKRYSSSTIFGCLTGPNGTKLTQAIEKYCVHFQSELYRLKLKPTIQYNISDFSTMSDSDKIRNALKWVRSVHTELSSRLDLKFFLIIDGPNDSYPELETMLDEISTFGSSAFIIITSSKKGEFADVLKYIELKEVSREEVMLIIQNGLKFNQDENEVQMLWDFCENNLSKLTSAMEKIRTQQRSSFHGSAYSITKFLESQRMKKNS